MFEKLNRSRIATVSNITRKNIITAALVAAGIRYYIRCRGINTYSTSGQNNLGISGVRQKYVADIFVDRENASAAKFIVRTL